MQPLPSTTSSVARTRTLAPRRLVFTFGLLFITAFSSPSWAEDDAAENHAREMLGEGLAEYNSGQFAAALDRFKSAFAIIKLPTLAVHMARANVKLNRFVAAAELYREALQLGDGIGIPEVQARARTEAQSELAVLVPRIPKLRIRMSRAVASRVAVQVDGMPLAPQFYESGWSVDPGTHRIIAKYENERQEKLASVAEGETKDIQLAFTSIRIALENPPKQSPPVADEAGSTIKNVAWVSFGIGGTGLLLSGITGLAALSNQHRADETGCNRQPYRATSCDESAIGRYGTFRTIAGVGFYTGLAGIVTGTALYFSAPRQKNTRDAKRHMLPWLGLESAGIEGSF